MVIVGLVNSGCNSEMIVNYHDADFSQDIKNLYST